MHGSKQYSDDFH